MSTPTNHSTPAPISGAEITALTLAVVSLVLAVIPVPFGPILALPLAIAAAIVGVTSVVNARRMRRSPRLAWVATGLAAAALLYLLIYQIVTQIHYASF